MSICKKCCFDCEEKDSCPTVCSRIISCRRNEKEDHKTIGEEKMDLSKPIRRETVGGPKTSTGIYVLLYIALIGIPVLAFLIILLTK